MTRKDHELIAKAIYGSLIQSGNLEEQDRFIEQHKITATHVALVLDRNNPRFDWGKFMAACGIKEV